MSSATTARIIPYEPRFERDLIDICWRTGLMGESLEGTGRFRDKRLFALLFVLQFPRSWPDCCLVAIDGEPGRERAVGYIVGTVDAAAQNEAFHRFGSWMWRILARAFFVSSWRYPESFRQALAFGRSSSRLVWSDPDYREADYPACLHMNLLPEYQGQGLGSRLMKGLLGIMRERAVPGIHLGTSERNVKALPFYEKQGFRRVKESEGEFWSGIRAKGLEYALKL